MLTRKINFSNTVSIPTKVTYVPSRDITLPTTARASKKNIFVITTNEQKNNICKTVSTKTKVQYVPSLHNIVPTTDRGNNDYAGDLAKSIANGTAGVNWTDEEKKANSTSNVLTEDYIRSKKSVEDSFFETLSNQPGKLK